jgi:hypothetical protein
VKREKKRRTRDEGKENREQRKRKEYNDYNLRYLREIERGKVKGRVTREKRIEKREKNVIIIIRTICEKQLEIIYVKKKHTKYKTKNSK